MIGQTILQCTLALVRQIRFQKKQSKKWSDGLIYNMICENKKPYFELYGGGGVYGNENLYKPWSRIFGRKDDSGLQLQS